MAAEQPVQVVCFLSVDYQCLGFLVRQELALLFPLEPETHKDPMAFIRKRLLEPPVHAWAQVAAFDKDGAH